MRGRFCYRRNARGQLMGVADLVIVIPATILCFFFLMNGGLSAYYKERIGQVANEAVMYAGSHLGSPDINLDTQVFTNEMCQKMNLPVSNLTAKVEKTTVGGVPAVTATIKADFDLIKGSPLPYKINLTEVGCTTNTTLGQVAVKSYFNGAMRTVYMPIMHRIEGTTSLYNPRLIMTDRGVESYTVGAPDL